MVLDSYERLKMYKQHRQRVRNAKSIVDSRAPQRNISLDSNRRELTYMEMLANMKVNVKGKASIRTFTRSPETVVSPHYKQQLYDKFLQCEGIQSMQMLSSNQGSSDSGTKRRKQKNKIDQIPGHVLKRYDYLSVSNDMRLMHKLLRPCIFMDLEVRQVRPLGRVVIQLYTEACPEVVLEFVRACTLQSHQRFNFTRLFPPMWMEGELALDDSTTLTSPNIVHDLNVISHGSTAGILSFPSRYIRGSKRRSLNFTISFKPITVLNGKRIAFGRIRRGFWILDTIQDYGTKNGKPLKDIIVTKCGIIR